MAYKIWLLGRYMFSFIDWVTDGAEDDFVFVFLAPFIVIAMLLMLLALELHIFKNFIIRKKPIYIKDYWERGY